MSLKKKKRKQNERYTAIQWDLRKYNKILQMLGKCLEHSIVPRKYMFYFTRLGIEEKSIYALFLSPLEKNVLLAPYFDCRQTYLTPSSRIQE